MKRCVLVAGILAAFSVLLSAFTSYAGEKPIVAVFDVEAKGVKLSKALLNRLSDYMANRLTSTGSFQVVPRDQIKKRLTRIKKSSFRNCYDQSCQIELGRELAAEKSLATQIIKLGSKCTVTVTLLDLRKATTEKASNEHGGCSEDEIVATLDTVVDELAQHSAERTMPVAKVETDRGLDVTTSLDTVSIDIESEPDGAEVFLDGNTIGKTPLREQLEENRTYSLRVELEGHHDIEDKITIKGRKKYAYTLKITEEERNYILSATEWIAIGPAMGGSVGYGSFQPIGVSAAIVTIKWRYCHWTIIDGRFLYIDDSFWSVGSRASYPLVISSERHQLRFGLGIGAWGQNIANPDEGPGGTVERFDVTSLYFSPSVRYTFQFGRNFSIGADVTVLMNLVTIGTDDENNVDPYPLAVFISIPFAFSM